MPLVKLHKFHLIPDTNAIYTPDVRFHASKSFVSVLNDVRKLTEVELFVSKIVADEICFRRHHIACKSAESASKSLQTIASITGKKSPLVSSPLAIKRQTIASFKKWAQSVNARTLPVPHSKIRWRQIIEASLWRELPFTPPPDDASRWEEKGFRDRLIFESVKQHCDIHSDQRIALVTHDELLLSCYRKYLGNKPLISIYGSAEEFLSFLRLEHTTSREGINKKIAANAGAIFYKNDDAACVYTANNLGNFIATSFSLQLLFPKPAPAVGSVAKLFSSLSSPGAIWRPSSDQKIFIQQTTFRELEGENIYHWVTRLEFVQMFKSMPMGQPSSWQTLIPDERMRISKFDVHWTSVIADDTSVSDRGIPDIAKDVSLVENHLLYCDIALKSKYGFPLVANIQPLNNQAG